MAIHEIKERVIVKTYNEKTDKDEEKEITFEKDRQTSFFIEDRIKKIFDDKILPSLHKKDKDCIIAIDGGEGCLTGDTLIKTDKGDITINELAKDKKEFIVDSLDIKSQKKVKSKAIAFPTGSKEVFEITTEDGRKVKATKNHTFFVLRNKKIYELPLSELKEEDELICE